MNPGLLTLIIFSSLFVLLLTGLPVAFALLGGSVILSILLVGPHVLGSTYSQMVGIFTSEILVACPLFIVMATILQNSGVATALYDMMYKWFGGLRGGLSMGTVVMCTLIAAMTGLGGTGVVTMGYLGYPEMEKRGYSRLMSLGCIPAGGALGPLIPPSNSMIIVAMFTSVSIGKLFLGGLLPGLLMAALFCLYIGIACWVKPGLAPALPLEQRASWGEKLISLRSVLLPILLVFLVLGTIYLGICTPSEAGGIGAFGALICAAAYGKLKWPNMKNALISAVKINAMVMWLLVGGNAFGALLQLTGVSMFVSETVAALGVERWVIVGVMLLITFILGMFMDAGAVTMILLPIFVPIVSILQVDMLWFALVFTVDIVIGYVTPPFGMNLFYTKGVVPKHVLMSDIYKASIPFVIMMVVVLIIGIVWTPLLTWLPNTMG